MVPLLTIICVLLVLSNGVSIIFLISLNRKSEQCLCKFLKEDSGIQNIQWTEVPSKPKNV